MERLTVVKEEARAAEDNGVNTLIGSMVRAIKKGDRDVLDAARSFGFQLRVRSGITTTEAQAYYHGRNVTAPRAMLRFGHELKRAINNGGEAGDNAHRIMESISYYPGVRVVRAENI